MHFRSLSLLDYTTNDKLQYIKLTGIIIYDSCRYCLQETSYAKTEKNTKIIANNSNTDY